MPQEPKERPANQPWPTFARLYKETSSMKEGFETQRAEYVYNTDSVNFEGSDEDKAKVKVENSTATEGFVAERAVHPPARHRTSDSRRSGAHLRGLPAP